MNTDFKQWIWRMDQETLERRVSPVLERILDTGETTDPNIIFEIANQIGVTLTDKYDR